MTPIPALLRDRAELLLSAGRAAEALERRCNECCGPTLTLSRDELLELSEQMQRVTSLLTLIHIAEANARHAAAQEAA